MVAVHEGVEAESLLLPLSAARMPRESKRLGPRVMDFSCSLYVPDMMLLLLLCMVERSCLLPVGVSWCRCLERPLMSSRHRRRLLVSMRLCCVGYPPVSWFAPDDVPWCRPP